MLIDRNERARHWRELATDMLASAALATNAATRLELIDLALLYDRLARRASEGDNVVVDLSAADVDQTPGPKANPAECR